jgi:hypothetical protein
MRRNVLLQSLVVMKDGRPHWQPRPDLLPHLEWARHDMPISPPGELGIDLTREIGLRVYVREDDDRSHVVFQFHHACADGYGMTAFLDDFMASYSAMILPDNGPPNFRTTTLERLRQRGDFAPPPGAPIRSAPQASRGWTVAWAKLKEIIAFLRTKPAVVAAPKPREAARRILPLWTLTHVFTPEESQHLRNVRLNDFAIARYMAALRKWNREHSGDTRNPLRVLMPTDLRTREDIAMPAANVSSFCFVTRDQTALDDEPALLETIYAETNAIKRDRVGLAFLKSVAAVIGIPGLLPRILRRQRCVATAVLSYLGDPTHRILRHLPRDERGCIIIGNTVVEQMYFAPPVRPLTHVVAGMTRYAGRLHLGLKVDPWLFTEDDARAMLATIVAEFRRA